MKKLFKLVKFLGMFSLIMLINILIQSTMFLGENLKTENYSWIAWLIQTLLLFVSLAIAVKWYELEELS